LLLKRALGSRLLRLLLLWLRSCFLNLRRLHGFDTAKAGSSSSCAPACWSVTPDW
jgi:hypothetical protein